MKLKTKFYLILVLAVLAAIVAYPREHDILKFVGIKTNLQVKRGLDLQGGTHLAYQADLKGIAAGDRAGAMNSLVSAIQRRINPSGTSEVLVQTAGSDRVIIECPGTNANCSPDIIGRTANLQFLEITNDNKVLDTGISGKDVDRADADFAGTSTGSTGLPIVRLRMKSGDSTTRFANVTSHINQTGDKLVTLLDNQVVFGPATVSSAITDGTAQLQGNFDIKQAKQIALEINAGALPVPITLGEQSTIGPTLGQEAVSKSLIAGLIGLTILAAFMIWYYRLAGLVAVSALAIYTVLMLSYFKLSTYIPGGWFIFSPIVLTLAGIAAFIISIGMAVDANILIFERMKEELRHGKSFVAAVEAGFDRAWPSIRDSNVTTLISTVILYSFSGGTPQIKGFAVTLAIGVLLSMFTAVVISRTFMRMLIRTRAGRNPKLYGLQGLEAEA